MAGASWWQLRGEALADAYALDALALGVGDAPSRRALRVASARRFELSHAIRRRQAVMAGTLVAASWQSPSIRHARCPRGRSGRRPRDGAPRRLCARSPSGGRAYERALAATRSPGCVALLTSCGMSAVVVGLAHLDPRPLRDGVRREHPPTTSARPRAARVTGGALSRRTPRRAFAAAIARCRPASVVIDAVATEEGVAVPDVVGIARRAGGGEAGCVARGRRHGCPA